MLDMQKSEMIEDTVHLKDMETEEFPNLGTFLNGVGLRKY